MRRTVFIALLVPVLALAAVDLTVKTVLPDERSVPVGSAVVPVDGNREPATSRILVGTVDTIGGTTYDWQANATTYQMLVHSPDIGIHALWMYSAHTTSTSFPDRNMRYNFYDFNTGTWSWIDPDFMASGVNVFTERSGYGSLDADPATGVAFVTSHQGSASLYPWLARDMAPGAGIFEYCSGEQTPGNYLWPPIQLDAHGIVHCALIEDVTRNEVWYSKVDPWCTWSTVININQPQPAPEFSNQFVAASKVSNKVCITWEQSTGSPDPGYYRESTDGGATWGSPTELAWPDAFGPDSFESYHVTAFYPYYDSDDQLHILTSIMYYDNTGQGFTTPCQIWVWSPDNTPNWNRVHWAGVGDPANMLAPVGYNALYACRPSMGEDSRGNLYVAWEQFDSMNVETGPPEVLRADIFVAGSGDKGLTWGNAVKLTDGGTGSHRFPTIINKTVGTGEDEAIWVIYEIDQIAGFFVQDENIATNNPMIVHKVLTSEVGVAEPSPHGTPVRTAIDASPNPFGGRTTIRYALPRPGDVSITVYDAVGRPVETVVQGHRQAGSYTATWDASEVPAGIYFYTLETDDTSLTEKLIVVQ